MRKSVLIKVFSIIFILSIMLSSFSTVSAVASLRDNGPIEEEFEFVERNIPEDGMITYFTKNFETNEISSEQFSAIESLSARTVNSCKNFIAKTEGFTPAHLNLVEESDFRSRVILGPIDRRWRINNTRVYPFSTVAFFETTWANGVRTPGTAVIINRYFAMTAAHNVYSHARGGWANSIFVEAGRNGYDNPWLPAVMVNATVSGGWINRGEISEDWALIQLNRNLGDDSGWVPVGLIRDYSVFVGRQVTVVGYPEEHNPPRMYMGVRTSWSG